MVVRMSESPVEQTARAIPERRVGGVSAHRGGSSPWALFRGRSCSMYANSFATISRPTSASPGPGGAVM
jgi:hypothetical protein